VREIWGVCQLQLPRNLRTDFQPSAFIPTVISIDFTGEPPKQPLTLRAPDFLGCLAIANEIISAGLAKTVVAGARLVHSRQPTITGDQPMTFVIILQGHRLER
jgi:hypothetical protein